jgi:hypothetical protein
MAFIVAWGSVVCFLVLVLLGMLFGRRVTFVLGQMRVREAKDFLVQQTAEQAAFENVPLSGLEKRMMYFTETGAFEAEYDTTTYEKKISLLMAQAYRRIKREDPEKLRLWNNAFRILNRGDHYLLLFWRTSLGSLRECGQHMFLAF